jgi:hypothetical protein
MRMAAAEAILELPSTHTAADALCTVDMVLRLLLV